MTSSQAKSALKEAGLKVGSITKKYSDTYSEGNVMAQQYDAGQEIDEGSRVSFTVSKGTKDRSGSVDIQVDLSQAPGEDEIIYMTVNVNDANGPHNNISDRKMDRKDGVVTVNVEGTGKGTITVILNGSAVQREKVDFSAGV